jgi:hypothetical protein
MSLWTKNDAAITREVVGIATVANGITLTLTTGATTGMVVGDIVVGAGIKKGTVISSITNATVFVISKPANNGTGARAVEVYGPDSNKPKGVMARDKASVYGVDTNEILTVQATHTGWVKVTTGTGRRAGRTQYETLVAMGSITGAAADNAVFPTATIVIAALATPIALVHPAALVISAAVTGLTMGGKVNYAWSVSANGTTGWTSVPGKTATLTVSATVAGTLYYRLIASAGGTTVTATSNTVQVVVS